MRTTEVIVGVDGSPPSWDALLWAIHESQRRSSPLRIIGAYRAPWPAEDFAAGTNLDDAALARTEDLVAEMVAHARTTAPELQVNGESVRGATVPILLDAAANAALLVVGSRGHDGFAGLLIGRTSLQVATHASVPVVVVRGRTEPNTGPVVVGSDASPGSDVALGMAFEEAALLCCGLTAIRAYHAPTPLLGPTVTPLVQDPEERNAAEHAALDESIRPWREKYPNVRADTVVTPDDPATNLIGVSYRTRMIVVGTRGHGGFAGLLLGSVGQKLIHHAHCPVLIARTPTAG